MAKEIERKYLIKDYNFVNDIKKNNLFDLIYQGYIFLEEGKHLRIRLTNAHTAELGLKYTENFVRTEYEYEIPFKEGEDIHNKCEHKLQKKRIKFNIGSLKYDLDIYPNKLEIIEIEFETEELANNFIKPEWLGKEITSNKKYSNIYLAQQNLIFQHI